MQHVLSKWHNVTVIPEVRTRNSAEKEKDKNPAIVGLTFWFLGIFLSFPGGSLPAIPTRHSSPVTAILLEVPLKGEKDFLLRILLPPSHPLPSEPF